MKYFFLSFSYRYANEKRKTEIKEILLLANGILFFPSVMLMKREKYKSLCKSKYCSSCNTYNLSFV